LTHSVTIHIAKAKAEPAIRVNSSKHRPEVRRRKLKNGGANIPGTNSAENRQISLATSTMSIRQSPTGRLPPARAAGNPPDIRTPLRGGQAIGALIGTGTGSRPSPPRSSRSSKGFADQR